MRIKGEDKSTQRSKDSKIQNLKMKSWNLIREFNEGE